MQVKITQEGLFIPIEWLPGFDEFEIRREGHLILIMPIMPPALTFKPTTLPINVADDPIWHLGEDPVDDEIKDASVNHDQYLYGSVAQVMVNFPGNAGLEALAGERGANP
jgi:hypothetical protein